MLTDANLSPLPVYAPAISLVAGAGVAIQVGSVLDLLGQGVGTAPQNIIGNASLFGMDPGSGLLKPFFRTIIGVAAVTANSATLNLQLQYAVDTGSGGNYQPGTWNTIVETGTVSAANMAANTIMPKLEFEPTFPYNVRPRFIRIYGVIPSATNFTAGSISSCLLVVGADEFAQKLAARNYTV